MTDFVGRLRTPRLASAPAAPVAGEMYYDTGTSTLYWWNGSAWVSAGGGATPAEELIQTITLGANGNPTFSSIPQTFKHLRLVMTAMIPVGGSLDNVGVRLNGFTSYYWQQMYGQGTTFAGDSAAPGPFGMIGVLPGTGGGWFGNVEALFPAYTTAAYHTWSSKAYTGVGSVGGRVAVFGGMQYPETNAITSLTVYSATSPYLLATGSVLSLYGMRG